MMQITDNRLEAERLELTSAADWLENILPTTRCMELHRIILDKTRFCNGLSTVSRDAYVMEYLVWQLEAQEPTIYRLLIQPKGKKND